ncbi:hypothetical protein QQ045_006390 [Rhodiola kirilowii]
MSFDQSVMGMSYDEKIALSRKIMIAGIVSLLTATILIIFLHLYAKYYLLTRQERMRRASSSPRRLFLRTDVVVPVDDRHVAGDSCLFHKAGLDALIIASLPKFSYDDRMNEGEEAADCSVCLSAVCAKDMVRLLPNCKHLFHLECIDKWLVSHTTCPICRTTVEPRAEVRSSSQVEAGSASVAAEGQGGSSSLLSSFRKLVSGEISASRVSNDEESR